MAKGQQIPVPPLLWAYTCLKHVTPPPLFLVPAIFLCFFGGFCGSFHLTYRLNCWQGISKSGGSSVHACLEDPLIHKKVLQTVFGIRAFFSAQIQFEHFLRLPRCLVKCPRENEPATRAQFPATRAQFSANRAQFQKVCKAKAPPRNLCICTCLILPFLAHLFATKARANICVSMGPADGYELY